MPTRNNLPKNKKAVSNQSLAVSTPKSSDMTYKYNTMVMDNQELAFDLINPREQ
jgi:hypothetical protein